MLIVGNWKAYVETPAKAKALYASAKRLSAKKLHEVAVAPAAPYIGMFYTAGKKTSVKLCAQDISLSTGGAETGEITAGTFASLGVTYAIIGHSERRLRGETDEIIAEKVRRAFAQGLTPILCIGETERDMDAEYLKVLRAQISSAVEMLSTKERLSLVIAYEPVWAIGATEAIEPHDLAEMVLYIRKVLGDFMPGKANQKVRILYGGSVDASNIRTLAEGTDIEGFLVGRASTDASSFSALVKALS